MGVCLYVDENGVHDDGVPVDRHFGSHPRKRYGNPLITHRPPSSAMASLWRYGKECQSYQPTCQSCSGIWIDSLASSVSRNDTVNPCRTNRLGGAGCEHAEMMIVNVNSEQCRFDVRDCTWP